MPAPLSTDLRERVLAAYERGDGTQAELAEQFDIAERTVRDWLRRCQETGSVHPSPHGGGQPRRLDEDNRQRLKELVKQHPDATLEQLIEMLEVPMDDSTLSRWCKRLGLTRKRRRFGRPSRTGRT